MPLLLYDAAELITSARNRAMVPDSSSSGTLDSDILRYLNEELRTRFLPRIISVREEYLVFTERVSLVANTSAYRISTRASGNRVRDVIYRNTGGTRRSLARISRELVGRYGQTAASTPQGFYLEWNHLRLVPDINASPDGSLELSYMFRPSELVLAAEGAAITSIAGGVLTIGTPPTAFTTSQTYDIHSPRSGAEIRAWDLTASAVGGTTITFTSTDVDGSTYGRYAAQVGDFVCLAQECVRPFLPVEFHPILAQGGAVRLMRAQGDHESASVANEELEQLLKEALDLIDDRVEGEAEIITNPYSFLHHGNLWGTGRADTF